MLIFAPTSWAKISYGNKILLINFSMYKRHKKVHRGILKGFVGFFRAFFKKDKSLLASHLLNLLKSVSSRAGNR